MKVNWYNKKNLTEVILISETKAESLFLKDFLAVYNDENGTINCKEIAKTNNMIKHKRVSINVCK